MGKIVMQHSQVPC